MTKPDVLVILPVRPGGMDRLGAAYTLHRYDEASDKAAFLAERGPRCRAVVTNGHADLTAEMLNHLPNLEIVACGSAGFDQIDVEALKARGIAFTNTSAALADDVADTALMLMLAGRRHLVAGHDYVRSGDWARKGAYPLLSSTRGKRAGIVGLGQIGSAIAARFEPLELQLGYTSRSRKDSPYEWFEDATALAAWSDILVLALPGGAETDGLIGRAVLDALGPQGTLVNIARGSVVDEEALIAALADGRLGHAALDVFRSEPDPDPRLTALPNVTLYPHHASGTVETREAMSDLVVDNLDAHFAGRPLLSPVYDLPAARTRTA
ncbi:2-hydroxyacid dehydrogenase [Rhodobacterales bacterium HKCCE2091]|nr:2-hydroxyacid dehydrogenase [Rhodobacterales bacterium HKCCE2091]